MALVSNQPRTEMSTRCISWGKGDRCVRLTNLPPSCAVVMTSGNLKFLEPSGPLQACNGTALPFTFFLISCILLENVEKYCRVWGEGGTEENIIWRHVYCMLHTLRYRHTFAICNTYCLSTGTMTTRTRVNITLQAHCLSCL